MVSVAIPCGLGLIGTDTPHLPDDGEGSLRRRHIKPFRMDATTSVTNVRFDAFARATGHVTEADRIGDSFVAVNILPDGAPPTQAVEAVP